MSETDPAGVTVFRAPRQLRGLAFGGIVLLLALALKVALSWGWLASIGILLVLGVSAQLYWMVLRPRLTVHPDGVEVVAGWEPVRASWKEVQRTEVGAKGTLLVLRGGREVLSRYPQGRRAASSTDERTDADRAAAYLAAMAAWARRGDGTAPPRYEPGA